MEVVGWGGLEMSRINIRKHRYSNFAKLVKYARSVEPRILSVAEITAIDEAAIDVARCGAYTAEEAKRAIEAVLNCATPIHIILPKPYRHVEQISEHVRRECVDTTTNYMKTWICEGEKKRNERNKIRMLWNHI